MDHQKSIISQVTLDTSSINYRQLIQTRVIPPIHAGQSSYIFYKHKTNHKLQQKPLPFGSTSSRVATQIEAKPTSHISGYEQVYKAKCLDQFDDGKIAPFGSSQGRFKESQNRAPGPGKYQCSQISSIKSKSAGVLFPSVGRQQKIKQQQTQLGPGSYKIDQSLMKKDQLRDKIRQKYKQKKQQIDTLIKQNKFITNNQPSMTFVNGNDQNLMKKIDSVKLQKQEKLLAKYKHQSDINRFILKENTQKYLPKFDKTQMFASNDPSCSINKNFMSIFIQKKDNAFQSYLSKQNDSSPGPAYYNRKVTQPTFNQTFSFKSTSNRKVFGNISDPPLKKQKLKLSYIL